MSAVAIIGASGGLGSGVARHLAAKGVRARLILRRADAATPAHDFVQGDLDQPESLRPAIAGIETLILIIADSPHQAAQGEAAIAAAKAAGVGRIVFVSAMLAGETPPLSFGVQHARVEQMLTASGMAHAILRPSFFMQSFRLFANDIKGGRLMIPVPTGRAAFVDRDDVAEAVAICVLEPGLPGPGPVYLTGGEALSFGTIAGMLSAATGTGIRHITLPLWLVRIVLPHVARLDRWTAARLVEMFAALEAGLEERITPDLGRILGRHPGTFASFLARERALFMK